MGSIRFMINLAKTPVSRIKLLMNTRRNNDHFNSIMHFSAVKRYNALKPVSNKKSILARIPYNPITVDWPSPSMITILAYHLICHSIVQFKCNHWYFTIEILFNMFKNAADTQSISITFTKPKHQTFVSYKKNPHPKHTSLAHLIHHPLSSNNQFII